MTIQVQPITEKHIPSLVKVHREAFAGYMNTKLGDGYIKAFLRWFSNAENGIAFMAVDEEENAIGYVVGAPYKQWDVKAKKELFIPVAIGVAFRPWLIFNPQVLKKIFNRLGFDRNKRLLSEPELHEPAMALVGIGVADIAKGSNCAFSLIGAFESEAYELKMNSMILEVYKNNKRARCFYEKCGWKPFIEPPLDYDPMFYTKLIEK